MLFKFLRGFLTGKLFIVQLCSLVSTSWSDVSVNSSSANTHLPKKREEFVPVVNPVGRILAQGIWRPL